MISTISQLLLARKPISNPDGLASFFVRCQRGSCFISNHKARYYVLAFWRSQLLAYIVMQCSQQQIIEPRDRWQVHHRQLSLHVENSKRGSRGCSSSQAFPERPPDGHRWRLIAEISNACRM